MIAVCLLTADRPGYTKETLRSFREHNRDLLNADFPEPAILLHADDGSADGRNAAIAAAAGFTTCYASRERAGQGPALEHMWTRAAELGCDRILHLENDWEFVAPAPLDVVGPCVRLYGARKERSGPRAAAGTRNLVTGEQVAWKRVLTGWERGETHWGGPPSITDTDLLLEAVQGAKRIKDISMALSVDTYRPFENIVWHIGLEPTPEHLG